MLVSSLTVCWWCNRGGTGAGGGGGGSGGDVGVVGGLTSGAWDTLVEGRERELHVRDSSLGRGW